MKNKFNNNKAFTLIELLVVVSIISLLSSIVMSSLNSARAKARDTRRIEDLRQIRTALELFYDDYGYYPQSGCGWDCNGYRLSYNNTSWNDLAADLQPYMSKLPVDPINSSCSPWTTNNENCFSYAYGNVGRNTSRVQYDLTARLEDKGSPYRCEVKGYRYERGNVYWCLAFGGNYHNQIYEASIN